MRQRNFVPVHCTRATRTWVPCTSLSPVPLVRRNLSLSWPFCLFFICSRARPPASLLPSRMHCHILAPARRPPLCFLFRPSASFFSPCFSYEAPCDGLLLPASRRPISPEMDHGRQRRSFLPGHPVSCKRPRCLLVVASPPPGCNFFVRRYQQIGGNNATTLSTTTTISVLVPAFLGLRFQLLVPMVPTLTSWAFPTSLMAASSFWCLRFQQFSVNGDGVGGLSIICSRQFQFSYLPVLASAFTSSSIDRCWNQQHVLLQPRIGAGTGQIFCYN